MMKKHFLLLFALQLIIFSSCDPDNKDIFNTERVKIFGTINNVNESISLGDTLILTVPISDTIYNQFATATVIHNLQSAEFYMQIYRIDTLNKRPQLVERSSYWTALGNISPTNSFNFLFNNNQKPYSVIVNFKPQQTGIYYLEVVTQPGKLKVNNSYEPRLIVSFNIPNKHIYIAQPYLGAFWANDADIREAGTYVFNVQ